MAETQDGDEGAVKDISRELIALYAKRKARDDEAREAFRIEIEKEDFDGIYMRDIIREEVKPDDARLR